MHRTVTLLILLATLAGCSDGGDPPAQPPGPVAPPPEDGKGLIRGVVVDAAVVPVEGATVRIDSLDLEAASDADGFFVLNDLDPGTYFLDISKPGWLPVQQSVPVVADVDEPPLARVLLQPDPVGAPYVQAHQWRGFFTCSTVAVQVCPAVNVVAQIAGQEEPLEDAFLTTVPIDRPPSWITSELVWESTQVAGDTLEFYLEVVNKEDPNDWGNKEIIWGPSSLQYRIDAETAAGYQYGTRNDIQHRIFPGGLDAELPLRLVGAQLDQEFEVFSHVFYDYAPAEDWRFTEDPQPPAPPA